MSADRALHLVSEADNRDTDEWRAETIARQWDPEHQLVGALMWLTATRAAPILRLVPDSAIWQPMTRWAYEIIRSLVDAGRDPDPVTVLASARHRAERGALQPDQPPTPARHHQLAVYLAAAYTQTVSPEAAASYAREVLDAAYRRAFGQHGIRMQQLAEAGASRAELTEQFGAIRDELAQLWRRAEAAAKPGWDTP
ncbi:hypothetical protein [uncultured Mycobacterium sp.]|uniref:hypothetical protein n=1 Tax=uncultured Mycobacterium sp. TaxID=171292 RepID=UPI0035C9E9F2